MERFQKTWRRGTFQSVVVRTIELSNLQSNLHFSVPRFEYVVVGPKSYLLSRGKYGKLHASKELLWVPKQAFFLPKASPINV